MAERSGEFDDIHALAEKEGNKPFDEVDATNEYAIGFGENLPNHSMTQIGRGKYISPVIRDVPLFRTRQSAYRFAGWLVEMAELLPDEDSKGHTFEQIREAIRRSGK